jgi:hypothetical protein
VAGAAGSACLFARAATNSSRRRKRSSNVCTTSPESRSASGAGGSAFVPDAEGSSGGAGASCSIEPCDSGGTATCPSARGSGTGSPAAGGGTSGCGVSDSDVTLGWIIKTSLRGRLCGCGICPSSYV